MSKKKVLSKFTISCWAVFIAILGHIQPTGHGWDTPVTISGEPTTCVKVKSQDPKEQVCHTRGPDSGALILSFLL